MPVPNPLCIGFHTQVDPDTHQVLQQDGYISAIQSFCFIVSLGFSITIAHWLTLTTESRHIDFITLHVFLALLMITALVVMLILWKSKWASGLNTKNSHMSCDLTQSIYMYSGSHLWFKQRIRRILPIIGIVLFYTLGCFLDILYIFCHVFCYKQFIECGSQVLARYTVSIIFHLSRFVFMGVAMLFCYVFHNRQMVRCSFVRYSLLSVLAAAVVIWFYTIIGESNGIFNDDDTIRNNCSTPDPSDLVLQCIHESTNLYNTTQELIPYMYALHIEFLLLVMEMLMHLFCLAIHPPTSKQPTLSGHHSGTASVSTSQLRSSYSQNKYKVKPILQRSEHHATVESTDDECNTSTYSREHSSSVCTTIAADIHQDKDDLLDSMTPYTTAEESLVTSKEYESNQKGDQSSTYTIPKGTFSANDEKLGITLKPDEDTETKVKQLFGGASGSAMHLDQQYAPPSYRDIHDWNSSTTQGKTIKDGRRRDKKTTASQGSSDQNTVISQQPRKHKKHRSKKMIVPDTRSSSAVGSGDSQSTLVSPRSGQGRRKSGSSTSRSHLNYHVSSANNIPGGHIQGQSHTSRQAHTQHTRYSRNNLCCMCCCDGQGRDEECQSLLINEPSAEQGDNITSLKPLAINELKAIDGPVCFFSSLVLNLIFVVCGFLTYQSVDQQIWIKVYGIGRVIYWMPTIYVCWLGFRTTKNFEVKERAGIKGVEMMVLMSTIGLGMYSCFTLQSAICLLLGTHHIHLQHNLFLYSTSEPDQPGTFLAILAMIDTILNMVQVFLQTTFMSHAFQVKPPEVRSSYRYSYPSLLNGQRSSGSEHETSMSKAKQERKAFLNILVYLLISNITLWLMDSFVDMKNSTSPVPEWYFEDEKWEIIAHITIPLALFYRFNSFILFTEVYLDN